MLNKGPQPIIPSKFADPSTSKGLKLETNPLEPKQIGWKKECCLYLYNKEEKTFCGRSCQSWFSIIVYSIMYLIFLTTYTMMFLYLSLTVIKFTEDFQMVDKTELLTYSENGIGLSANPTSVNSQPIIWYRDEPDTYKKYVDALEVLLKRRQKRATSEQNNIKRNLGPCGITPFGYGNDPCVLIKINKLLNWKVKPLKSNSSDFIKIPKVVTNWIKTKEPKLWLHCSGYNNYDKEHIGIINYYPDPPGFNPDSFPIDMQSESPMVAVQFSGFTFGVSVAVKCNLWYEGGMASTEFVLYVTHKKKVEYDL